MQSLLSSSFLSICCLFWPTHTHTHTHTTRFIKHKLRFVPDDKVAYRDGKLLCLGEVFTSLGLTGYELSIDTLDMHAQDTFHRFDRFNLKYNPCGSSRLREIFLKTDNKLEGLYLAQITQVCGLKLLVYEALSY